MNNHDVFLVLAVISMIATVLFWIIQILRKHLRYRLMTRAWAMGWTYLHINRKGLLVGVAPSPADNHEFLLITRKVLHNG